MEKEKGIRDIVGHEKTVGILTFYFADNYGAVLQCYALRKTINNIPGFIAEIVPFIPKAYRAAHYWTDDFNFQNYLEKRSAFKCFLEKECGLNSKIKRIVTDGEYSIYCVGSDQVWNRNCINSKEYFLPNVTNKIVKISYAASVGLEPDNPDIDIESIRKYVSKFDYISVREFEHVKLLEDITGKQCYCVLDPTLLLTQDDYEQIVSPKKLREDKFLFFFFLPTTDDREREAIEFTNSIARKYKLKIVHNLVNVPSYMFESDYGCMYFEGVENYLWYMKNADFIITNSYHGTIFATQFKKPFYTFVLHKVRTRIDTLVKRLGIENRVIEKIIPIRDVSKEIDYAEVEKRLNGQREDSLEYLKRALGVYDDGSTDTEIEM